MIRPRASIRIAATPDEIISFIADPSNALTWMVALDEYVQITPGPVVPGTRFREVMHVGGRRVEMICEVTVHDPGRRWAWKSVSDGDTAYGGGFTAEPGDDGMTTLTYEGWATTTGDLARREEAWGRQAQREAASEVARIKAAVEARCPD